MSNEAARELTDGGDAKKDDDFSPAGATNNTTEIIVGDTHAPAHNSLSHHFKKAGRLLANSTELILWVILFLFAAFVIVRHRNPNLNWGKAVPKIHKGVDHETNVRREALGIRAHHRASMDREGGVDDDTRHGKQFEDLEWHPDPDFLDQRGAMSDESAMHVDVDHLRGSDDNNAGDEISRDQRKNDALLNSDDYYGKEGKDGVGNYDAERRKYDDFWESERQYTPRPTRRSLSLEDIKKEIHRLELNEELSVVRLRLKELEEMRKQRDRINDEYSFADEQEAFRDKEREWQRRKWDIEEQKFENWLRRARRQLDVKEERSKYLADSALPDNRRRSGSFDNADDCPGLHPRGVVEFQPYSIHAQRIADQSNAYVTFVTSAEFVPAAATLMHSIAVSGSQYARVICITEDISAADRATLALLGQLIVIDKISSPKYIDNPRYRDTFTKLRIWQLAMYKRILYIDTDVVVVRNMDDLFDVQEWGVPMDAEQNRYSTGMMVCDPSLATFDEMMEDLKTTTTSMELPDLLFLKHYFDNEKRGKKINIIPRWYQVYQEEFGSQYSTYLTNRKQKITIFDDRIHGIHYPGDGKPWKNFHNKHAKFSPFFCNPSEATQFQYEPQFLWYLHHELAVRSLRQAKHSAAGLFDYEGGAGSAIDLKQWAAEQKKRDEEEKSQRNRWSSYKEYNSGDESEWQYVNGKWVKGSKDGNAPHISSPRTPSPKAPSFAKDETMVWQWQKDGCKFAVTDDLPHELVSVNGKNIVESRDELSSGDGDSSNGVGAASRGDSVAKGGIDDESVVADFWGKKEKGKESRDDLVVAGSSGDGSSEEDEDVDTAKLQQLRIERKESEERESVQQRESGRLYRDRQEKWRSTRNPYNRRLLSTDDEFASSGSFSTDAPRSKDSHRKEDVDALLFKLKRLEAAQRERDALTAAEGDESSSGHEIPVKPVAKVATKKSIVTSSPPIAAKKPTVKLAQQANVDVTPTKSFSRSNQQLPADEFDRLLDAALQKLEKSSETEQASNKVSRRKDIVDGAYIDFSLVKPFIVNLPQEWSTAALETYTWVISWCQRTSIRPDKTESCGKPSFVSQYSLGLCRTNFDDHFQVLPIYLSASKRSEPSTEGLVSSLLEPFPKSARIRKGKSGVAGVVFRSRVQLDNPDRFKWFEVVVRCDTSMAPHKVGLDERPLTPTSTALSNVSGRSASRRPITTSAPRTSAPPSRGSFYKWNAPTVPTTPSPAPNSSSVVLVTTARAPHDRLYRVNLKSRCACLGGCDSSLVSADEIASALQSLSKESPGRQAATRRRYATRLVQQWKNELFNQTKSSLLSQRCEALRSDAEACLASQPQCDFDVSRRRCTAPRAEWIAVERPLSRKYCNCTHVGGDGDKKRASLDACLREAKAAGANVVNFFDEAQVAKDNLPETTAPPLSTTTLQQRNGGRRSAVPKATSIVDAPLMSLKKQPKGEGTPKGTSNGARGAPPKSKMTFACYYKKCSEQSLLLGTPSLAEYTDGGEFGFDIHMMNPFFGLLGDDNAAATASRTVPKEAAELVVDQE